MKINECTRPQAPKRRNFVAKAAKEIGLRGEKHRDKKQAYKRREKYRKSYNKDYGVSE